MISWLRQRFQRRPANPRIELTPDGFVAIGPDGTRSPVRWDAIVKVAAYKRDLMTTDEIMLAVESSDHPGRVQEFSEEWDGFSALFEPLEQQLGISPARYMDVMVPAFEPRFRVLFDRAVPARVGEFGEAAG